MPPQQAGLYMPVPPVSISGRFIMTAASWIRTAFVIFLGSGSHLLSRTVSSTVSSAARGLTFVFGMGTGVPPGRIAAGIFLHCSHTVLFHCSGSSMYRTTSHTLPPQQSNSNPAPTSSPRKEVIQPHLPIRLPCYDFTPVTGPAFGSSLLSVGSLTSGISDSHGVTGGVYKTRERIHRGILIRDY